MAEKAPALLLLMLLLAVVSLLGPAATAAALSGDAAEESAASFFDAAGPSVAPAPARGATFSSAPPPLPHSGLLVFSFGSIIFSPKGRLSALMVLACQICDRSSDVPPKNKGPRDPESNPSLNKHCMNKTTEEII
jgi:hypothetical protein